MGCAVTLLKACSKCGRIHSKKHKCDTKTVSSVRDSQADQFRNTQTWKKKAIKIKERDLYLCRVCLQNLYNTNKRLNNKNLSVHHITPLKEDFELRLDSDNLITLCSYHHELAESGAIPSEVLRELAKIPPYALTY